MANNIFKSPNSRSAISIGPKLHVVYLRKGLHLGYRRSKQGGAWFGRKHKSGTTKYVFEPLGVADDVLPANGIDVLSYDQAVRRAERWFEDQKANELGVIVIKKNFTVADLMPEYLEYLRITKECKSPHKTQRSIETHILPTLGSIPLKQLSRVHVERWMRGLVQTPPRLRTRSKEPVFRDIDPTDDDYLRKRKASANRIWNIFRSMMNFAYREEKVKSKQAWDKIESFKAVNEPKIIPFTLTEFQALVAVCDPDFKQLAEGAFFTACRYAELGRMQVRDFKPNVRKVYVRPSKNGLSRWVSVDEGFELFEKLTRGRQSDEFIFLRADGERWGHSHQQRPMLNALRAAGLPEEFTFHQIRHLAARLHLEGGMTMEEVASLLGHRDPRLTGRVYAQFSPDHMEERKRKCAPRLYPVAPQNPPDDSDKVIRFRKAANT
jgi:integrase